MDLGLKGITSADTIYHAHKLGVNFFGFDLRPKSFNFIQGHKIKSIMNACDSHYYSLIFEHEKEFMVNGLYGEIKPHTNNLDLEFTGIEDIKSFDQFGNDFYWRYHDAEKIMQVTHVKNLKRIILDHKILEQYHHRGELFGFLQLFSDLQGKVKFDLLLDWDTEIISTMFEYFDFNGLVFEINNKIEASYQNVDHQLLIQQLTYFKSIFQKG